MGKTKTIMSVYIKNIKSNVFPVAMALEETLGWEFHIKCFKSHHKTS